MMSTATAVKAAPSIASSKSNSEALVNEAMGKLNSIGTLPEVTVQIIKTVEDPKSSASQLNAIVAHDPSLVSRVLKVVNSSFYGLPGQVSSIERAIVLLGLNGVKNLAVAASLGQLFRGAKLCEQFGAKDLWTHCIAVAVGAKELALKVDSRLADEAFLAGMIHDIGLLAELQIWPEKLRQVCTEAQERQGAGETFCQLEDRIIGVDHEQLGRALAQRWRFPRSCQDVAGNHHNPTACNESKLLVGLVHIADIICCQQGHGFNLTAFGQQPQATDFESIGLNSAICDEVAAQLPAKVAEAVALFA
jgi:putative nucleotidyltransferase with HDIG domain